MTNKYTYLIVQEMFEGVMAYGEVELRENGTRFGAPFHTLNGNVYTPLGIAQYSDRGIPDGKDVYSKEAIIVLNMVPGQTVVSNYINTMTSTSNGSATTRIEAVSDEITFAGFENITMAGRTFANTCKLTTPSNVKGQMSVSWVAKEFGMVRSEEQTIQGVPLAGTRNEIVKILSAP
ncbi:hypothetical protein IV454_13280 [Massilia antarctica]|uniref:Uncharacterized protein n=2 Tax=Massilia antarctica TaxID=2765360 RepID=A0AA48WGM4_9BURK|nr:hypothetical protein [Massilia antarctica]QPI52365.1 hypothetical protein IV454_13280 [Massilia antarctica]